MDIMKNNISFPCLLKSNLSGKSKRGNGGFPFFPDLIKTVRKVVAVLAFLGHPINAELEI